MMLSEPPVVKKARNASRPSAAISSLALKTYRGVRPCRQSISPAESAFIRAKISARERPTDGSALRMKWRAERPEQRRSNMPDHWVRVKGHPPPRYGVRDHA